MSSLQPISQWLLRTTLQASLLIFLILVIQSILGNRLGIRWRYCLWLLLLVRMALPWAPQSRISMFNLIPHRGQEAPAEHVLREVPGDRAGSIPVGMKDAGQTSAATTEVAQAGPQAATVTPQIHREPETDLQRASSQITNVLPLVWLAGALVLAAYVCASNFNLWWIVKSERPLIDQPTLELLEDCKSQMGVKTIIGIVVTDKVRSPALFGFVRPRLLMPRGMIEALGRRELRHVFLHELAHLRRHDIFVGYLVSLLQTLHWFNPLVWLAFHRLRADRELACDALALSTMNTAESTKYGRTVVHLLENFLYPRRLPSLAGISEDKSQIKRRITMIARFKKNSYRLSPLAVILIIILGCASVPEAKRKNGSGAASGVKAGPTYRLVLDSKIAGMPVKEGTWGRHLDFSPSGDRIVFESQDKLYIADETGTLIRPILDNFAPWDSFAWPRWSPDGRQIAYGASRKATSDSRVVTVNAIFVLSPDGGTPRQITPERRGHMPFAWLRWTYDGKHLTYLGFDGVHTLALDGSEVRFIPSKDLPGKHHRRHSDGEYSPNGRWLAYCGRRKDPSEERATDVWILPAAGGQAQALRLSPGSHRYPTWAPDGRSLYFVSGAADTGNIWKVAIDPETALQRGQPQQMTFFNDAKVTFPKALGDGSRVAFELQRINTSIHVANASPPYEPRTLARGRRHLPQVSPDGQTIYYVNDGIFAVPREGGTPRRLTKTRPLQTHGYLTNFHLSGDGRTLAYVTQPGEWKGLFTLAASGGEPQLLVKITTEWDVVPQWSPDGSQLAYAGGNDLYVIDAAGGQPRKIAHLQDTGSRWTGWDVWTVRWSPDGKFIAAIGYTTRAGNTGVFVVPASGGELRQLTPDDSGGYLEGVEWHPDGQRLSYNVDRRESETRQAYLDGRPPTLLVDHPDGWDYIGAWGPDGRRFFYISEAAGKEGYGIYAYDEASGDITLFADHAADQSPPRWSRDGKTAAWWVTRKTARQAWVMENFLPSDRADN